MAKRKNKNQNESGGLGIFRKISSLRSQINPETEKSIIAIFFICFAVILILASIQKAGPAGEFIFLQLTFLFGLGYYLFPFIMLIMAGDFLVGEDEKYRDLPVRLFGASFFIMSGLGLIDVISNEKGGLVGQWMGAIQAPFGYIASIIIITTAILASLLLALNIPLKVKLKNEMESSSEDKPVKDFKITGLENSEEISNKKSKEQKIDKEDKKETENTEEEKPKARTRKPFFMPKKGSSDESFSNLQTSAELKASLRAKNYTPPPLNLLKSHVERPTSGDLHANANIIKRTLDSFGIPIEMGEISIGPKVTRYSLKPAEGIKLSRITALNQDLALALAAHPIRMEAPIPGKSLVGIEVPNKSAAIVRLGSLITSPEFINSGTLGFIIGRDVTGKLITGNLAKMPHLLIAGSTGSGKSVSIHTLLMSLLYKNSPETLKLILIDPKRVELTIYDDIPHLISPVIIEGKKALGVFRWAISEMERRYEQLQMAGVRDIGSYNKKNSEEKLPYIVIVVDELADLMTAYGRDIESSIVRLAQMARATGIHLVLSTQRPSVEVITGLIKANISARIALKVASQVDSRTILDMGGAEKLLGGGDMLFINSELSKPKRIQGAFVSEEELHSVTSFIKERNEGDEDSETSLSFNPENVRKDINDINFDDFEEEDGDELFSEAVEIVRDAKKASTSFLQRKLAIGYARAARLIDMMEDKGIVGPGEGAKAREVYPSFESKHEANPPLSDHTNNDEEEKDSTQEND
jgi:DNA segregation ATPase FtsK/SpoIIIE, S-DNA-T family